MTPTQYYQNLIASEQILRDPQQEAVISYLQVIYDGLMAYHMKSGFLLKMTRNQPSFTRGLYLYGEVGIGKTFLIDCFFYCLPFKLKLRIHFHKFMGMVHEQLTACKHEVNPLLKVAKKIARNNWVICLDELIVNDITDAMLLAGLFKYLYQEKTCLLFTSNTKPDNLYLKGIQRESFLPAIEFIKHNSEVIHLASQTDYRLQHFEENTYYFTPLNEQTEQKVESKFLSLSKNQITTTPIKIQSRQIQIKKCSGDIVWFDFMAICGIPRSQNDYLEIATKFKTIIISDVQVIQPEQNDLARSFINLIDVLYDAKKRLIISAEVPIEQLYFCGRLLFEFARTRSRIKEMQTETWQRRVDNS